jgi:hypothetical protein
MKSKQAIYKYDLNFLTDGESLSFDMPIGAKPLCVQVQYGKPVLWCLCDPRKEMEPRGVYALPTGKHEQGTIPEVTEGAYVGTIQLYDCKLVLHVFVD